MTDNKRRDDEYIVLDPDGNKTLDLHVLVKALIQICMGKALDLGRVSGMSDRSFQQYEKIVKDEFYKTISYGQRILDENGYKSDKHDK
jgi:hypothetical protein